MVASTLYACPVFIESGGKARGLYVDVSTAAAAGKVVRLGVYDDLSGVPGALLLDAGTVAGDAVGIKFLGINLWLPTGWHWLALLSNGTPTVAGPSAQSVVQGWFGYPTGLSTTLVTGVSAAQAYGALPAVFPSATFANCPGIGLE